MVRAAANFDGPRYYDDCLGPLWFDFFAADLVQRLPENVSGDVLEIACGTGMVTKKLRERLKRSVRLVATDVSRPMLDYARAKLARCSHIEWCEADAMMLPFADGEFGAVLCGFGLMFMPDRQSALFEMRRVTAERGILLLNVWDAIDENPHALANASVLANMFPNDPEMTFTLPYETGNPDLLSRLLERARFRAVRIQKTRLVVVGADPRSIATGQIRGTPRATLIERRGVSLDTVIDRVADALTKTGGDPYHGQAQGVIVEAEAI